MNNKIELLNEVKYLHSKYGCPSYTCLTVRREHPNIKLDSKEMEMLIYYNYWLTKFLDGDRSLGHFVSEYPEYKQVYLDYICLKTK